MELFLASFFVYYLSYILVYTDGPFGLFHRFKSLKVVREIELFNCIACISFWISSIVSVILFDRIILYTLAIAGIVIFIDKIEKTGTEANAEEMAEAKKALDKIFQSEINQLLDRIEGEAEDYRIDRWKGNKVRLLAKEKAVSTKVIDKYRKR